MSIPIRSHEWSVDAMRDVIREYPEWAPDVLLREYHARRPRYTLIRWLKRHGARPATTRVIRSKP